MADYGYDRDFPNTPKTEFAKADNGMGIRDVKDSVVTDDLLREDPVTNPRRITGNFTAGGFVLSPQAGVKMKHKVVFESAGSKFTVTELMTAFYKIPAAGKISEVHIKSWDEHFNAGIEGERTAKDAEVAVIEWVE